MADAGSPGAHRIDYRFDEVKRTVMLTTPKSEVKAAAGHASLLTTSVYLHVVVDEREEVGDLFAVKAR